MIANSFFFFNENWWKTNKKKTRKKMRPIHSHETRRGRGRSCWVNADKTSASRAKRKERNKRNRKENCAYMREQSLPRQSQVVLTATMHAVGIRCVDLGHVALQLHFTCSATLTLFLSFEVDLRGCCDSAVDFTGKKVVSVVAIFKIEVARDFYVTKQRIMRFLGCFSTSR